MLLRNNFGMRTRQAAFDRVWRSMRLTLSLALGFGNGLGRRSCGGNLSPSHNCPHRPPGSLAFARYIASLNRTTRPAEWQTVAIEIEASLPGLAKRARLPPISEQHIVACRI